MKTAAVYFLSFKEAAANKKLLDHNLKEKRVQRLPLRVSLFYIKIGKPARQESSLGYKLLRPGIGFSMAKEWILYVLHNL